jgi:Protein of unknown function (DUF2782)
MHENIGIAAMHKTLTRTLAALAFAASASALAAETPPPPGLEPLPEAEPPPPEIANDPELQPQITIVRRDKVTMEEYRLGGRLVWVKVTPQVGRPYFLVPEGSNGALVRRDSLDSGLRVPMWLLFTF